MLAQVVSSDPGVDPNLVTREVQAAGDRLRSLVPLFLAAGFAVIVLPKLLRR